MADDDPAVREKTKAVLEISQFHVSAAGNVAEAIHLIDTQSFDASLPDMHMPGARVGFIVMSAMGHKHPNAIKLLLPDAPPRK